MFCFCSCVLVNMTIFTRVFKGSLHLRGLTAFLSSGLCFTPEFTFSVDFQDNSGEAILYLHFTDWVTNWGGMIFTMSITKWIGSQMSFLSLTDFPLHRPASFISLLCHPISIRSTRNWQLPIQVCTLNKCLLAWLFC